MNEFRLLTRSEIESIPGIVDPIPASFFAVGMVDEQGVAAAIGVFLVLHADPIWIRPDRRNGGKLPLELWNAAKEEITRGNLGPEVLWVGMTDDKPGQPPEGLVERMVSKAGGEEVKARFLPRSLNVNGNFKIATPTDEYCWQAENTPMGEMRVAEPVRLVGTSFEGSPIDANFWTTAAAGTSAAIAQGNAQLLITSGTSNAATVTAFTVRRGRYIGGTGMRFRAVIQVDAGTANNTRRWGIGWGSTAMPTVTDGAWFSWSGTTFQVETMKGGVPATVRPTV